VKRKPNQSYTRENVQIWIEAFEFSSEVALENISAGRYERGYAFQDLSRAHESMGLALIAKGEYGKALGHFGAAAEVWAELITIYLEDKDIEAGGLRDSAFGPLLDACASATPEIVVRLTSLLKQWVEVGEVSQLSKGMVALTVKDVALAKNALTGPLALDKEDEPWAHAPRAIANHDEDLLKRSLEGFTRIWRNRVRREGLSRHPDAVCDHLQIGWIRLWEHVWGALPDVDLGPAGVPREIFDAEPVRIPTGI
jgi:hypothetical protein